MALIWFTKAVSVEISSNYPLPENNIKQFFLSTGKNKSLLKKLLTDTNAFEDVKINDDNIYLKRKPVLKKVIITGNESFWKRELLAVSGIYENMYISKSDLRFMITKLRQFYIDNGFFKVKINTRFFVSKDGFAKLIIKIKEGKKNYIEKIRFISDRKLPPEEERKYLKILNLEDRAFSIPLIESAISRLSKAIRNNGYFDAYSYIHSIAFTKKGNIKLNVAVIYGFKYRVKFVGNYQVPKEKLPKANEFFKDGFNYNNVESFVEAVKRFYHNKGFIDADVDFEVKEDLENRVSTIVVYIYEGKPYIVNDVYITSDADVPFFLERKLKSFKGKTLDMFKIKQLLSKQTDRLRKDGFANSYYTVKVNKFSKENKVNVYIKLFKGKKYLITNVKFKGYKFKQVFKTPQIYSPYVLIEYKEKYDRFLKKLGYFDSKVNLKVETVEREKVIEVIAVYETYLGRRYKNSTAFVFGSWHLDKKVVLWTLKQKGVFEQYEFDNELNTLNRSYIFKFVNPQLQLDKEKKKVHKSVNLIEEKRGNIQGSLAYNSVEKLKAAVSLTLRNLFRYGIEAGVYVETSNLNTNYRAHLADRLLPKKFFASTSVYSSYQIHRFYELLKQGANLTIGRNANKWVMQTLNIDYSDNNLKKIGYRYYKYDINFKVIDDHRNNKIYPYKGYYIRGIVGNVFGFLNYQYAEASGRYYLNLFDKVVFTQRLSTGFKFEPINNLPISERYFIGGIFTVRGFAYEEISNNGTGGNSFVAINNDLRFPVLPSFNLYGFVFADFGNVFPDKKSLERFYLRKTAGAGFMVPTPAGSFIVDIATILDRKPDEDKYRIEFSISAVF